jgi:hypothetical protein
MTCQNGECGHPDKIHNEAGCRKTGCPCTAFVLPEPATAPPKVRRVCVDVPDGYVLSISLIPEKQE